MWFVADCPPPCSSDSYCDNDNNNNTNIRNIHYHRHDLSYIHCSVYINTCHIITVVNTVVVVNTHPINIAYAHTYSARDGYANKKP